jgi:hypothetical protein
VLEFAIKIPLGCAATVAGDNLVSRGTGSLLPP